MSDLSAEKVVAEWTTAMEGVSAGPWRHYRAPLRPGMGIINEVQCRAKAPVVQWTGFDDSNRKEVAHARNAAWIARCSPSGIRSLLDLIAHQAARLKEVQARLRDLEDAILACEGGNGFRTAMDVIANYRAVRRTIQDIRSNEHG